MFSVEKVAKPLDFWGKMCYNGVAEQSRAEQSRAEQSRAEQSRAEQSNSYCYNYIKKEILQRGGHANVTNAIRAISRSCLNPPNLYTRSEFVHTAQRLHIPSVRLFVVV